MRELQGIFFYNSPKDTHQAGPVFRNLQCGWCHATVDARLVARWVRGDGKNGMLCACSCGGPTALIVSSEHGPIVAQAPAPLEFKPSQLWPQPLSKLFGEAASAYAAGAYTACAMVCRKILMACACEQGDADGQSFAHYVDYITNTVLTYPKAKASIDQIRQVGNDANHDITFVAKGDAEKAMRIITYLLDTLYAFPQAQGVASPPP